MSELPDLRVIIVEDQALLAMELELVLGESGCDVVGCAMDQASALAIAARERPDLARAMILTSAREEPPPELDGVRCLDKPIDPQLLFRTIEERFVIPLRKARTADNTQGRKVILC